MSGNPAQSNAAVVLLSGGLDSTAALCWALHRYLDVRAFGVDYGQPNRDAELVAARNAAETMGVTMTRIAVADALRPVQAAGLMAGVVPSPGSSSGIDRAFVPGRNLLLATVAISHACTWWPEGPIDLVIGACAEDQAGFPDCRPATLGQLAHALSMGVGRTIRIRSPWADRTKREILYALQPDTHAFNVVRRSWSCYQGHGPCGSCGACVKRDAAFADLGVADLCAEPVLCGGDPQRELR